MAKDTGQTDVLQPACPFIVGFSMVMGRSFFSALGLITENLFSREHNGYCLLLYFGLELFYPEPDPLPVQDCRQMERQFRENIVEFISAFLRLHSSGFTVDANLDLARFGGGDAPGTDLAAFPLDINRETPTGTQARHFAGGPGLR